MEKESDDYKPSWSGSRRGATFEEQGEATRSKIVGLEVFPESALLETRQNRQLIVRGVFADASTEDLTHQVHYESSSPGVATISAGGV